MDIYTIQNILFYKGIGSILAYISCVALAVIMVIKNPRNRLNIIFSIISFIASIWNMTVYFIIQNSSPIEALLAWKIYSVSTILLLAILTYFCSELCDRKVSIANMILTVLILTPIILFTNVFINGVTQVDGIFFQLKGPGFILLDLYRLSLVLTSILFLYQGYKNAEEKLRERIKFVSIGIGVALLFAIFDILIRIFGFEMLPLSSIATIFTLISISYSFKTEN